MDISRATSEEIKIWLAAIAIALVFAKAYLSKRAFRGALIALTLVAGLNYVRWGPKFATEQVDSYDVIHYYLCAKYFDELGYFGLYPAAALVDFENGPYAPNARYWRAKVPEGYRYPVPIEDAIARGRELRETRFTEQSWKRFEHDFLFLQREKPLTPGLWVEMLGDRGFNGTPPWLVVAKPIAQLFPVEWIKLACYLDVALLALALVLVGYAYGLEASLWSALFLFITYSLRWPNPSWAFLRYDWIAALLAATALLKLGRNAGAGVATAYATGMRIFPLMWLYGPAMKALFGLFDKGKPFVNRIDKKHVALLLGFVGTTVALEGAATAWLSFEARRTHTAVILEHTRPEELSSRRVGLALGMVFDGQLRPKNLPESRKLEVKEQTPLRLGIAAVILFALGFGLRKRPDDEAFAYGFGPFFLITTASYYYYVARAPLVVIHSASLERWRDRVGLALLFGLELMSNTFEVVWPGHRVFLVGYLCWGLLAYVLLMSTWLVRDEWRARSR